jgi:hypothetical protein
MKEKKGGVLNYATSPERASAIAVAFALLALA